MNDNTLIIENLETTDDFKKCAKYIKFNGIYNNFVIDTNNGQSLFYRSGGRKIQLYLIKNGYYSGWDTMNPNIIEIYKNHKNKIDCKTFISKHEIKSALKKRIELVSI